MSWLPKAMARGSQELGMIDVALGWRGWKAEGSWMSFSFSIFEMCWMCCNLISNSQFHSNGPRCLLNCFCAS